MILDFEPGDRVVNPSKKEWGIGQVQSIINEKGKIEDPKVVKKLGAGCDEEALRVLKKSKFKPGYDKGKPVKVRFTLPIFFRL